MQKLRILDILEVPTSKSIDKYLGCSNIDRKRTIGDFLAIKEKINSRLANWKATVLSQAGQTVLIKSKLAGIPFMMKGIKISNYAANEIYNVNRYVEIHHGCI